MSCKSLIYTTMTTPTTITLTEAQPTAALPLGSTLRRFGCNLDQNGNGINAENIGYFGGLFNASVVPVTAGDYTLTVYVDGVAQTGSSQTITAVANASIAFNVPFVIRNTCCSDNKTITAVLSTTATLPATVAVNNVSAEVEKK